MDRRSFLRAAAGGLGAAVAALTARKGIGLADPAPSIPAPSIPAAALDVNGTFAAGAVSPMTVTARGAGYTTAPADFPLVTWIECPSCSGVFLVQRTNDDLLGQELRSANYMMRDGSAIPYQSRMTCGDCGEDNRNPFIHGDRLVRRGPTLPPKPPILCMTGPVGPGIFVENAMVRRDREGGASFGRLWGADLKSFGPLAGGQSALSGIHLAPVGTPPIEEGS